MSIASYDLKAARMKILKVTKDKTIMACHLPLACIRSLFLESYVFNVDVRPVSMRTSKYKTFKRKILYLLSIGLSRNQVP